MYMAVVWGVWGDVRGMRGNGLRRPWEDLRKSGPSRNLFFWGPSQAMSSVFLPSIFLLKI